MSDLSLALAGLIASIVGSIATVVALAVAIHIGVVETRRFRAEAEQRDYERREVEKRARQRQAECVSAMAELMAEPTSQYTLGSGVFGSEDRFGGQIDVTNASPLPLYGVKVRYPTGDGCDVIQSVGFVPGHGTGHTHVRPQPDRSIDRSPVLVSFRDASGLWWERCTSGHLTEHADDPYPLDRDKPD